MKIIFIRHGDPDYAHDSLTEKGWREARALSEYMSAPGGIGWEIDRFYCSPLGRARDTASLTLRALGQKAEVLDFFREFNRESIDPRMKRRHIPWDFYPVDWVNETHAFDALSWNEMPVFQESPQVYEYFSYISDQLDALLAEHGYVREGRYYLAKEPSHQCICIFCHFGVASFLLSHLLNFSPIALLQGGFMPPTGLTLVQTEERDPGIAYFRMNFLGATPHLTLAGEPMSGSGLFKECATDPFPRIGTIHSLKEVSPEGAPEKRIRLS